jgi:hypothetical protein
MEMIHTVSHHENNLMANKKQMLCDERAPGVLVHLGWVCIMAADAMVCLTFIPGER